MSLKLMMAAAGGGVQTTQTSSVPIDDIFALSAHVGTGAVQNVDVGLDLTKGKIHLEIANRSSTGPYVFADSKRGQAKVVEYVVPAGAYGGALSISYIVNGSGTQQNLTGTGTLTLPVGAEQVTLTGHGANGTHVFVAGSPEVPAHWTYITGITPATIQELYTFSIPAGTTYDQLPNYMPHPQFNNPADVQPQQSMPSSGVYGESLTTDWYYALGWTGVIGADMTGAMYYSGTGFSADGLSYTCTRLKYSYTWWYGSPAVPDGYQDTTGPSTTAKIDGVTYTFVGGTGLVDAATTTKTVPLNATLALKLSTNTSAAQMQDADGVTALTTTGFTLGSSSNVNTTASKYIAKLFKTSPKFFDYFEYVGNGASAQILAHGLNIPPGMVIIKATDATSDWIVRHQFTPDELKYNSSAAATGGITNIPSLTSNTISVAGSCNLTNTRYIAYLFAHDASTGSLIKTGTYMVGTQHVSNDVAGAGSITIPAGVTSVTFTGSGGAGTIVNNPGQPYIAPFWTEGSNAIDSGLAIVNGYGSYDFVGTGSNGLPVGSFYRFYYPLTVPTVNGVMPATIGITAEKWVNGSVVSTTPLQVPSNGTSTDSHGVSGTSYFSSSQQSTYGEKSVVYHQTSAPVSNSGQPYIAPSTSTTVGSSTVVSCAAVSYTYNFAGGNGTAASVSQSILSLPAASPHVIQYNVSSGGTLNITYNASTLQVSNKSVTLTGTGTFNVPNGVTSVTMNGSGAPGSQVYNSGTPEIQAQPGYWKFMFSATNYLFEVPAGTTLQQAPSFIPGPGQPPPPSTPGNFDGDYTPIDTTIRYVPMSDAVLYTDGNGKLIYQCWKIDNHSYYIWHAAIDAQPATPAGYQNTTGASTSFVIDGNTYNFAGGNGGAATTQQQQYSLSSNSGEIISYVVPAGGSLNVAYNDGTQTSAFSQTVTGVGSITIPVGISALNIIGAGSAGTTTYVPGQPAQQGTPDFWREMRYMTEVTTMESISLPPGHFVNNGDGTFTNALDIDAMVGNTQWGNGGQWSPGTTYGELKESPFFNIINSRSLFTNNGNVLTGYGGGFSADGLTFYYIKTKLLYRWDQGVQGTPATSPSYTYTDGQSALANYNGTVYTFPGGHGGAATPQTASISIPGAAGTTISYSVPSGGSLQFVSGSAISPNIDIGFEPQYVIMKKVNGVGDWTEMDILRSITSGESPTMSPNTNTGEKAAELIDLTSNGFRFTSPNSSLGDVYAWMAIRRSNKVPTDAYKLYEAVRRTGTGVSGQIDSTFAPDMVVSRVPNQAQYVATRLTGRNKYGKLGLGGTKIITASDAITGFDKNKGIYVGVDSATVGSIINRSTVSYLVEFFKRATGFMDLVKYQGSGSPQSVKHNLGANPNFWLVKSIDETTGSNWVYGSSAILPTQKVGNNVSSSFSGVTADPSAWNSAYPSNQVLSVGSSIDTNAAGTWYEAVLFASLAGVSNVFKYVGDGNPTKNIDCGFSNGARFILVLRADASGAPVSWNYIDGITSGVDPYVLQGQPVPATIASLLNAIQPLSGGFTVTNNTDNVVNLNVQGVQYFGLAIA